MGTYILPTLQIDPISFWNTLHHLKLNQYKLLEDPIDISGFSNVEKDTFSIRLNSNSFPNSETTMNFLPETTGYKSNSSLVIPGALFIFNTLSEYKSNKRRKEALSLLSTRVRMHFINVDLEFNFLA